MSHRTSTSQSASQSASASASTSQSASQSASASASTSQSASQSASTSESASQSASLSASAANVTSNNGGGSGSGSSEPSSASESSQAAPATTGQNLSDEVVDFADENISITSTIDFNEVNSAARPRTNATANTTHFNEVGRDNSIGNNQVPLAVVLDRDAEDIVVIKDEETPLGIAKSGAGARVWWYWILIIISAVSGKVAKDKRKAKASSVENIEE
ncbi:hypothetical protein [Pseudobutyrivibrio sp. ACV-2]|uniref:hypothetical protein n=1 Tax=Pseudobutyrivibrio sp. ACV-2 TaxID=1520801 RepID=UPI00147DE4A2|nr:hypothetical protein [Pseudobutyrivibrio sp. ACV-2]